MSLEDYCTDQHEQPEVTIEEVVGLFFDQLVDIGRRARKITSRPDQLVYNIVSV